MQLSTKIYSILFILFISTTSTHAIGVSPINITNNELYIYNDAHQDTTYNLESNLIENQQVNIKANQRKLVKLSSIETGTSTLSITSNSTIKQTLTVPITTTIPRINKFNYIPIFVVLTINLIAAGASLYLWKTKRF